MTEPAVAPVNPAPPMPPPAIVVPPAAPVAVAPPAPPPIEPAPVEPVAPVLGRGGSPVPEEAISDVKRKEREAERKRLLKAEFGTDDPAEVEKLRVKRQADAEELTRLREESEARKRSEMTEIDQLKADLQKATTKIAELTAQLEDQKTQTLAQKQNAEVRALVASHKFKEKFVPFVNDQMAQHYAKLTKTEQGKFGRAAINAWLAKYAKENQELVEAPTGAPPAELTAPPAAAAPAAAPKPPVRTPATNGKQPVPPKVAAAPAAPDPLAGLTPRPGLPNSMNDKQLKEYMNRQGMKKSW